jgi:hypothetical protein
MAEKPKQDWVWVRGFGMKAYLPSDDGKPATGHIGLGRDQQRENDIFERASECRTNPAGR